MEHEIFQFKLLLFSVVQVGETDFKVGFKLSNDTLFVHSQNLNIVEN